MEPHAGRAEWTRYELIDAGDARRLERFGARRLDRPAPTAIDARSAPQEWTNADLRFDGDAGWAGSTEPWTIELHGLILELRATSSGGIGLYPEHGPNVEWL